MKRLKSEKGMTGDEFRDLVDKEIDELVKIKRKLTQLEERIAILEGYAGIIKSTAEELEEYATDTTTLS